MYRSDWLHAESLRAALYLYRAGKVQLGYSHSFAGTSKEGNHVTTRNS